MCDSLYVNDEIDVSMSDKRLYEMQVLLGYMLTIWVLAYKYRDCCE